MTRFFILLFLFCSFTINAQIQNLELLVQRNDRCVLKIFTLDEYGEFIGQGSGVLIDSKGIAVTNYHVLEGATNAIAISSTGEKFSIEKIIDYSIKNDLVKFKLENTKSKVFPKATLFSGRILKGSAVFAIGYPKGFDLMGESTVSQGIVSGIRQDELMTGEGLVDSLIQTTAQITHGSSGGGLFDSKGNLIGITQGTFATSTEDLHANLNKAISVMHVKTLKRNLNFSFDDFLADCAKYSLYAQGVIAYDNYDYSTCYDLLLKYQNLGEQNRLDPKIWYLKGNCAFHIGRQTNDVPTLKIALENYFYALDLDTLSINVRAFIALTFEELNEMDLAFEIANEGYRMNPNNAFISYVLGKLYNVTNKRDLAIKYLTNAISKCEAGNIDPNSLAKWYLERAVAFEMKEDLTNAEFDFLKCLKINQYDIGAWYHYGSFLLYCKKYEDACYAFQNVFKMNENYTDYNGSISNLIKLSCK